MTTNTEGRRPLRSDSEEILRRYLEDTDGSARRPSPVPGSGSPSPVRVESLPTTPVPVRAVRSTPRPSDSPPRRTPSRRPEIVGQPAPPLLGGKYRLGRMIARGGLGEVFEATHDLIGQHVAVKMIRSEYSDNAELSARFLQEARAASSVGHPGCVQVHDAGVSPEGRTYIVMERLDGEDLLARLRRNGPLPIEEAAAVATDVLDVLAATHAKGIVHRDLKPENIFLARGARGEQWVKLLDFGIARLSDERQSISRLTRPGTAVGTPYYMAPEQARGAADVDGGVDIYATGVVLYEALTGRLPFEGASYNEVMAKVLSDPFPSPRAARPDIPEALEAALLRAVEKRRVDRFATAQEFALALMPFAAPAPAVSMTDERLSPAPAVPVPTPPRSTLRPAAKTPSKPRFSTADPVDPRTEAVDPWGEITSTITPTPFPRRASSPRPISVPAPAKRTGRAVLLVGGFVLSALLVVTGLLVGLSLRGDRPAEAGARPAAGAASDAVRVRVVDPPAGAEFLLDGRPVRAEFDLPISDETHRLEVRLGGRSIFSRMISATSDVDLRLPPAEGIVPAAP